VDPVEHVPDGREAEDLQSIYIQRFGERRADRVRLWQTLVDSYFQRYVRADDTVLDLAAGYCEFINAVRCGTKIAVDLNPTITEMADADVRVINAATTSLPGDLTSTVDLVWVSNFFEHLPSAAELLSTLREVHRVLVPGGRLLVLQPNIRLAKAAYWDFLDHSLPLTEKSLCEALRLTGFEVEELKVRFLPYTTESRLPVNPTLIRLYLRFPPAHRLLGKQTFAVARRV
jgi:SAM-dependent methyltransferase